MYNIHQPGAPILRGMAEPKKKDRRPVIRYGRRGPQKRKGMSSGEEIILDTPAHLPGPARYLMGAIPVTDASSALSSRRSLEALFAISFTQQADILVDDGGVVDHEVRAVLAHYALRSGRNLLYPAAPLTRRLTREKQLREFAQHVGEDRLPHMLTAAVGPDGQLMANLLGSNAEVYALLGVAGQPLRDFEQAKVAAGHLRCQGWNQARVREHLSLHGFANSSGTLGVWNHAEFKKLSI